MVVNILLTGRILRPNQKLKGREHSGFLQEDSTIGRRCFLPGFFGRALLMRPIGLIVSGYFVYPSGDLIPIQCLIDRIADVTIVKI